MYISIEYISKLFFVKSRSVSWFKILNDYAILKIINWYHHWTRLEQEKSKYFKLTNIQNLMLFSIPEKNSDKIVDQKIPSSNSISRPQISRRSNWNLNFFNQITHERIFPPVRISILFHDDIFLASIANEDDWTWKKCMDSHVARGGPSLKS